MSKLNWQCSGCHFGFRGDHQKKCPSCGREDYWCGSVSPDAKEWKPMGEREDEPTVRWSIKGSFDGKDKPRRLVRVGGMPTYIKRDAVAALLKWLEWTTDASIVRLKKKPKGATKHVFVGVVERSRAQGYAVFVRGPEDVGVQIGGGLGVWELGGLLGKPVCITIKELDGK